MSYARLSAIAAVCLAWTLSMTGQTPRLLRFEPSVIEIDTVRYDAGTVNVRFVFENICDRDVSVIDVHTQCGCTRPSFSRNPVKPGEKGYIDVTFDPSTLFAEQKRHMTVIATNGEYRKFSTITVHGYVARDVTEEEVRYPYELSPGLRSEIEVLGMRLNRRGDVSEKSFTVYNSTDTVMALGWEAGSTCVDADVPSSLPPRSSARITVRVDTSQMESGEFQETLFIFTGGRKSAVILKGAVE